jgi:hypothetical protein
MVTLTRYRKVQIEEDGMVCACSTHEMKKAKRMLVEALNGRDKTEESCGWDSILKSGLKWSSVQCPVDT